MSEDRRYDETYADAARSILRRFVKELGTQEAAAEALGFKQPTISRSLARTGQPTLKVLIALRQKIGLTLDEILGLPPISVTGADSTVELKDRLRTLLRMLDSEDGRARVKSKVHGGRK